MGLKKIGLDTCVFIYHLDKHPTYFENARAYLKQIQNQQVSAVFSAIGLVELLTGPNKIGDWMLAVRYRNFFDNLTGLTVQQTNNTIIEVASYLRATYNIRTPDAIHIATAIDFGASTFITNDKSLTKIEEISVKLL
ncbi:MAG: PIN domain-containing protein [Patescibacteria group bacterium]|jgi:predicted nucleic acid-binding protein